MRNSPAAGGKRPRPDRNYGGILIIWDRLFGTFADERPEAPIVYGLVHPIGSLNPLTLTFHEWFAMARDFYRASSWRARLTQLFGRPGDSLAALCPRANIPPSISTARIWSSSIGLP